MCRLPKQFPIVEDKRENKERNKETKKQRKTRAGRGGGVQSEEQFHRAATSNARVSEADPAG
jgi:hypothetical protein